MPEYRDFSKDKYIVGPAAVLGLGASVAELVLHFKPEWRAFSPLLTSLPVVGPSAALSAALNWPLLSIERFRWFNWLRSKVGRIAMAGEAGILSGFGANAVYDTRYGQKEVAPWLESTFPFLPHYEAASAQDLLVGTLTSAVVGLYMGWQYSRCNPANPDDSSWAWKE